MKIQRFLFILALLAGAQQLSAQVKESSPPQVLILGVSASGKERIKAVPEAVFQQTLGRAMGLLQDHVMQQLSDYEATAKEFSLSRVTAGLNIETEFGLGPVVELGTESVFSIRYQPLPR